MNANYLSGDAHNKSFAISWRTEEQPTQSLVFFTIFSLPIVQIKIIGLLAFVSDEGPSAQTFGQ
ncbi:MAG: hypothetical protein EOP56_19690 [Sphingobacteriales bacterium]|nr:MAG: hypothetical protein EOP56_19690 [Sphingobacteriales bacterium]